MTGMKDFYMSYRYAELACYKEFGCGRVVPLDTEGNDLTPKTEHERYALWLRKVIDFECDDEQGILYVVLR